MVADEAGPASQRARDKLLRHEDLVGDVVRAAKSEAGGRDEAEPRVERGVPDNHHGPCPVSAARIEPSPHQLRADSLALALRPHRHWGQPQREPAGVSGDRDGRKENMAEDRATIVGHEGDDRGAVVAQAVDEIRLRRRLERGAVDLVNPRLIAVALEPDRQVLRSHHTILVAMPGIDAALLDLTERLCQRFQELTGQTNVWIAVQLTNLSIIVYFLSAAIYFPFVPTLGGRIGVGLFCATVLYALTQTVFKESIKTAEGNAFARVAKGLRNPRRLRDAPLRISFLMMSVLMLYMVAFVYVLRRAAPQSVAYRVSVYVALLSYSLIALTTVLLYVIACDPLPPCAGKVRIWLAKFAPTFAPQRLPAKEAPIPVPDSRG
jgi:hypothetical protein